MENEENKIVDVESTSTVDQTNTVSENKTEPEHDYNKDALTAFILSVIGASVGGAHIIGAIAGLILGIISLSAFASNGLKATKNPFKVFGKIGKILAIVIIAACGSLLLFYMITFISGIYSGYLRDLFGSTTSQINY